jgi:signal transduction histidine kinase
MRIYDNGKGFDSNLLKNGIGLSNIKKRTELFVGEFIINSSVGQGCEVLVNIPLKQPH